MQFQLKSQRTGAIKQFSIVELLNLLGNPENDEIQFDANDSFNLSSFKALDNGADGVENTTVLPTVEYPTVTHNSNAVSLSKSPPQLYQVALNGLAQKEGLDFRRMGLTLQFKMPLIKDGFNEDVVQVLIY